MRASPTSTERLSRPWRPLAWMALQLHLLGLGLGSLVWSLMAWPLARILPVAVGRRLGRVVISRFYGLFWRISRWTGMVQMDASALDVLRDEAGLMVVANHPSMLDAMMLVSRLPHSACIMKASLMRNPLLGPGARLARYICNDSAYGMIHSAVRDLQSGGQLVLFPEATRTTDWPLNHFHPSFALIAKRARSPIQTVFIDTDSPYLGKGWPLWRLPPLPIRFSVRLGRRFAPGADPHALCREVESYIAAHVRRRAPPSESA